MSITKNQVVMVYMTARNVGEARRIGKAIVAERLAACVNIIPEIQSLYWWDGKVHDDREVAMTAKTRKSLLPRLIEKVKSLHSYSVPCIVAVPVVSGNPDYLAWVKAETRN